MKFKECIIMNEAVYETDNMWNADRNKQWVSITSPITGKKLTIHVRDWDLISEKTRRGILGLMGYKIKNNVKGTVELSKEEAQLFVDAVKDIEEKKKSE